MKLLAKDMELVIGHGFQARRAVNGGWIVTQAVMPGEYALEIAAFSNTDEMLAWLATHLKDIGGEAG